MRRLVTILPILFGFFSWAPAQNPDLATSYYHFSLARMHELNKDYAKALEEYDKALKADPVSASLKIEYSRALWLAGENSRAVEECKKAIGLEPDSIEGHHLLGKIYFNSREEDLDSKALEQFEKVLKLDPNHQEALFDAAQIELKNRNYEVSASYFDRVRKLDPTSVSSYYYGAQALLAAKKRAEALSVLEAGLRYSRDIPDYLILLGRLYEEEGESAKAAELYRTGLKRSLDPRLMEGLAQSLMSLEKQDEAIPYLKKLLKVYPQRLELKLELAKAYRMDHNLEDAKTLLEEILESVPGHIEAGFELGRIEAAVGDRPAAIKRFEALADSTKGQARQFFRTELALLYSEEGRYPEAIEIMKELVEASPGDEKPALRLFYTYKQASFKDEALQLAESLKEEYPDKVYVNIAYSQALAEVDRMQEATQLLLDRIEQGDDAELLYGAIAQLYMSRSDYSEAQQWIEKGLERFPDSVRLRFQLGAVLERQKVFEDAEAEFKKILAKNPEDAEVLNYLGYMLTELDTRLDEALQYILKAVELDPYNGAFLDSLGWIYFKQNRLQEAEEHLQKAARINQFDPVILEHLGDLYTRLENPEKARYFYEQSLAVSENEEGYERVKEKLDQLLGSNDG